MLHAGPYDITLADLEAAPHGLDLGMVSEYLLPVLSSAERAKLDAEDAAQSSNPSLV